MEDIKEGNIYQVIGTETTYTINKINETNVDWTCEGKEIYYKKVTLGSIKEWIADKRLEKIGETLIY